MRLASGTRLGPYEIREVIGAQVHPYDRNYLRHGDRLGPALAALDDAVPARTNNEGANSREQ